MTIVINEFEVVAEDKSAQPDAKTPPKTSGQPSASGVTPYAIQCIIRWHKEHYARVRAH